MKPKIVKTLTDIGLDEKEAKVYISALEMGASPASVIAKKAGLNRVTTYGILQDLSREGLVQITEKKEVSHFLAVDPEVLVFNFKQKTENLEALLPDLKSLISGHEYAVSRRFFEGIEAVKEAYQETLLAKSEILNYANSKNIREHWPTYDKDYVQERAERQIFLRGIYPKDRQGKKVQKEDTLYFRQTRLLSKRHFLLENEIKIYDDKFFIASFAPAPFAILIQSETISDSQKQIFEIAWSFASK